MRIIHIDFTGTYNEDMSYQENLLPRENSREGHDVVFITSCYKWDNGVVVHTTPEDRILDDGVRLIRLEYKNIINKYITNKIRYVYTIYGLLKSLKPDIIMVHCLQAFALEEIIKYKKENVNVKLFADSHTDLNNSARSFFSKYLLHKVIYKRLIKKNYKHIDKLFYVTPECKDFLTNVYDLPEEKMEFLPLGGNVVSLIDKNIRRSRIRTLHNLTEDSILFIHSGKLDKSKRTLDLLNAFTLIKSDKLNLYLIGSIDASVREKVQEVISNDQRVKFLGWKTSNELLDYLCSADMYLQPGTQSATMQSALCCGCPVMLFPYKSHIPFLENNGFFVETVDDIEKGIRTVLKSPQMLKFMSENSYKIANEKLDYRMLAQRIII